MKTAVLAIGIMLLAANGKSGELGCERAFVMQSWELLKLSFYGHNEYEHAAFIVRDPEGAKRFVMWPYHRESLHATYIGRIPENTVAVIHTHPNSVPFPSAGDIELASRTRLPVYVVTRSMISRTEGHGVEIVWYGDWNPEQPNAEDGSLCGVPAIAQLK